ncbi:heme NO-binding domain-containing protein [Alishewanella sp. d11]|uniref:heme NO-binding domain-containing protein n=1 Tax=Alishewanella sp. d11 TaxID=3414030 RepID=UPI003BF8CC13
MKGMIFNVLEEMVIEKLGMAAWNTLLTEHAPPGRVYVSAKNYDDSELFALAAAVANTLNLPLADVVRAFGHYLFQGLAERHIDVVQRFANFNELVMGIHNVIHVEVNKLYVDPALPTIRCEQLSDTQIKMIYQSPRKLCLCAEGLLYGAAEYYQHTIHIQHDQCMHQGATHCELVIERQDV